jgi:hypothetical protein
MIINETHSCKFLNGAIAIVTFLFFFKKCGNLGLKQQDNYWKTGWHDARLVLFDKTGHIVEKQNIYLPYSILFKPDWRAKKRKKEKKEGH